MRLLLLWLLWNVWLLLRLLLRYRLRNRWRILCKAVGRSRSRRLRHGRLSVRKTQLRRV